MTPTETATQIIQRAEELGVTLGPKNGVLTVQKSFEPGDSKAYVRAESDCNAILRLIKRTRPGSTWGTDSGSIGGITGLQGGYCRLNKSGVDKRVTSALAKMLR